MAESGPGKGGKIISLTVKRARRVQEKVRRRHGWIVVEWQGREGRSRVAELVTPCRACSWYSHLPVPAQAWLDMCIVWVRHVRLCVHDARALSM